MQREPEALGLLTRLAEYREADGSEVQLCALREPGIGDAGCLRLASARTGVLKGTSTERRPSINGSNRILWEALPSPKGSGAQAPIHVAARVPDFVRRRGFARHPSESEGSRPSPRA